MQNILTVNASKLPMENAIIAIENWSHPKLLQWRPRVGLCNS